MSLIYFLTAGLGILAILHLWGIPSLESRIKEIDGSVFGYAALLSVLVALRGIVLIFVLATTVVVVAMLVIQSLGGVTVEEVNYTLELATQWKMIADDFSSIWGGVVTLLLTLALMVYVYREGKQRAKQKFEEMYEAESKLLSQLFDNNQLEELSPTPKIAEVQAKMAEINQMIDQLDKVKISEGKNRYDLREELTKQFYELYGKLKEYEIQRRVKMSLNVSDAIFPKVNTKWEKFQAFFISQGLLTNLSRVSRIVILVSLILLIPSLIVIYSDQVKQTLSDQIASLQHLKIELVAEKLEEARKQLGEPKQVLSEEDQEIIDDIINFLINAIHEPYLSTVNVSAAYSIRSSVVRDEVLSRAVKRENSDPEVFAKKEKFQSGSGSNEFTPEEQKVVRIFEEELGTKRARAEPPFKTLRTELEDIAQRSPGILDKFKAELSSFQKPVGKNEIVRALINETIGQVMEGTGVDNTLGTFIQEVIDPNLKPEIKELYEASLKEVVLNLIEGNDLKVPLDSFQSSSGINELDPIMHDVLTQFDTSIEEANKKLQDFPPAIRDLPESHVNLEKATKEIESYRKLFPLATDTSSVRYFSEAVADFVDYFPPQLGAQNSTIQGELLHKWLPPGELPSIAGSSNLFSQARNFIKLQGFSRVGGVLIGRNPKDTNTSMLDFVDIKWKIEESKIQFILVNSNGQEFESKLYRMPIAYYALNYAADGRPLTITMVKASPMEELKILLHPTLIDTPMGYRVIELDRFVDTYRRGDQELEAAVTNVCDQHALYLLAWERRAEVLEQKILTDSPASMANLLQYMPENCRVKDFFELKQRATKALEQREHLDDPNYSLLKAKSEFYDRTLVDLIVNEINTSTDLTQFEQAVTQAAKTYPLDDKLREKWGTPPPKFEIWSGVREKEFSTNPTNILMSEESTDYPFDFILQVAFTGSPVFSADNQDQLVVEGYSDTNPWEFPYLKQEIHQKTLNGVQSDKRSSIILADTAEFTYLQRLFRLAFDGYLGKDFPVEKIVDLVDVLEKNTSKEKYRTLRWNANSTLRMIYEVLVTDQNREQKIDQISRIYKDREISVDDQQITEMVESYISKEGQEKIKQLLRIREELGVLNDEVQVLMEQIRVLPPLD